MSARTHGHGSQNDGAVEEVRLTNRCDLIFR